MKIVNRMLYVIILFLIGPLLVVACGKVNISQDWRTADRSPQNIAPLPESEYEAVVQVYAARAFSWRGIFAVHTWIATKAPHADNYTIYQVIGWRLRRGNSAVSISEGVPNQKWFGSDPILLLDKRGDHARELVDKIDRAARLYPFADTYTMWPGPNSNSFIAWIGLKVPELNLALPTKALGKNWMESKFTELQLATDTGK